MIAWTLGWALAGQPGELEPVSGSDPAAFADHLLDLGDAFNALTWYRRALFERPDRPDAGALRARMALAYERGDRYDDAEASWLAVADDFPELRGVALYRAAALQLEADRPSVARMHLQDLRISAPGWAERADLVEGMSWLAEGRLEEGGRALTAFSTRYPTSSWAPAARTAADLARQPVRRRSPVLAGAMSLVLPGSGQVYAGNPGDGLMAFAAAGLLGAWSATLLAYGVEQDRGWATVSGGVLGGAAAFVWVGNVVGASRGARRTNAFLARRQAERSLAALQDPRLELRAEDVALPPREVRPAPRQAEQADPGEADDAG